MSAKNVITLGIILIWRTFKKSDDVRYHQTISLKIHA